jgi:hypothetical protein
MACSENSPALVAAESREIPLRPLAFELSAIRKLAWFAGEAGFYDESVMKTFTVTEWVNRLFNGLQARASIWLNQVALREAPD